MYNLIVPCDYYQYMSYEKMLADHFHLRLMTMYKRLYITDPLNGVLKQNLMKTCLSKSFAGKFLKKGLSIQKIVKRYIRVGYNLDIM